jgi:hypothetical protein
MSISPGSATKPISYFYPYVREALQNRSDITDAVAGRYVKRAVQEICESMPFEELKLTGPTVQLTIGQPYYPVSFFLQPGDDYVQIPSFIIFVDFPQNTVQTTMMYKTVMAIDPMLGSATQGLSSRWTRFGNQLFLGPTPNQTYSVFMRYQKRHSFPLDENNLGGTMVHVPDTWEEIIAYAAAERIAVVKRWNDQATYLHNLLWGDPATRNEQGKLDRPGLIAARTLQIERDQQHNSRQLMIRTSRYNSR